MNMNSLIIVAGGTGARLFRTARTNNTSVPVELLQLAALVDPEASGDGVAGAPAGSGGRESPRFAHQIAENVARFARDHVCNPVILVTPQASSSLLLGEIERELPKGVYVRSLVGELTELTPTEVLQDLQDRGALSSVAVGGLREVP